MVSLGSGGMIPEFLKLFYIYDNLCILILLVIDLLAFCLTNFLYLEIIKLNFVLFLV